MTKNNKFNEIDKKIIKSIIVAVIFLIIGTVVINESFLKEEQGLVYVTNTGEKYHSYDCHYLKSVNAIGKNEAEKRGYAECSYCNGKYAETVVVNHYGVAFGFSFVILMCVGPFVFMWYVFRDLD